jgi:hypothetical protein
MSVLLWVTGMNKDFFFFCIYINILLPLAGPRCAVSPGPRLRWLRPAF